MSDASKVRLVRTGASCPEQYNAYLGKTYVGYLRLRHGCFTAETPDGTVVYSAAPEGDGSFLDHERVLHLNAACRALSAPRPVREEEPIYDLDTGDGIQAELMRRR